MWNMAMSHIGSKSSIQQEDEKSPPANACRLWYPVSRIAALEAYNWGFARKSSLLTTHSLAAPTLRWGFRYAYPSDCIAPRLIENPLGDEEDTIPFEIENADDDTICILTNQEQATLIYTKDVELVDIMPVHFMKMVALYLAHSIVVEITGKSGNKDRLLRDFEQMAITAPSVDANFGVNKPDRDASWVRGR